MLAISLLALQLSAEAPPCTTTPSEELVESLVHLAPGLRSDVVRLAPIPLYNTHHEVWRTAQAIGSALADG